MAAIRIAVSWTCCVAVSLCTALYVSEILVVPAIRKLWLIALWGYGYKVTGNS